MSDLDVALAATRKTPVWLCETVMDRCGLRFGEGACTATGVPCYNTFRSCRVKNAYQRVDGHFRFISRNAPLIDVPLRWATWGGFRWGNIPYGVDDLFRARPYIKDVKMMACEIKDSLTQTARIYVEFYDEPDDDQGIDPYRSLRSSFQGTFWAKFFARYVNFKGKPFRVYEGAASVPVEDYRQVFEGIIDAVTIGDDGIVTFEIVDLIRALSDIDVPPKVGIKLAADVTISADSLTLSSIDGIYDPPAYILVDDEIIGYTGVTTATKIISGLQRGSFATVAAAHDASINVQPVRYYAPANPYDILVDEMLIADARYAAVQVDRMAFDDARDNPGGEIEQSAIITEPTKLGKLYFELLDLLDCKSWVAEDLKISIARNFPNHPDRVYWRFTNAANFLKGSVSVDMNDQSRINTVSLYWGKTAIGKDDEVSSYSREDIAVDGEDFYEQPNDKTIMCRWLRTGYLQEEVLQGFIDDTLYRVIRFYCDALPLLKVKVDLQDAAVKTGQYGLVTTDALVGPEGMPFTDVPFQVVKRQPDGSSIELTLQMSPGHMICYITPDDAPDWDDATEDERRQYGYIADDYGYISGNVPGYEAY